MMQKFKLLGLDVYSDAHATQEDLEHAATNEAFVSQLVWVKQGLEHYDVPADHWVIYKGFVRAYPSPLYVDPRLHEPDVPGTCRISGPEFEVSDGNP
jgi:hypothetical protein